MNILITGSQGFIGKNIKFFLKEKKNIKFLSKILQESIKNLLLQKYVNFNLYHV